ncbi:MAG: Translation initiation factor 2 subunit beta [Candidatus Syntrophoarchaeum sp. GoM_oil]|nr:MAG: Translation initiation factor 2 subunit beta [Candidatus Syntrophoarchaeum sp. GoM_oil]
METENPEDYVVLLDRALERTPRVVDTTSRFTMPKPSVFIEGKTSILDNFGTIVDYINRDPDHLMKFLLRELGTAGKMEGNRAIFQGKFSKQNVENLLNSYLEEYVICSECGGPDTHLIKNGRIMVLECDACGAHRSILKRSRQKKTEKVPIVEVGGIYDLKIEDIGRKGDGIARMDKYIFYIPYNQKGDVVKVRVKKISGTLVFTELVAEEA